MNQRILKISPGFYSGQSKLEFPYARVDPFRDFIKQYAGCLWNPEHKCWTVPNELLDPIRDAAVKLEFEVDDAELRGNLSPWIVDGEQYELSEDLKPWQREGILRALVERTLLVNFDTGLGKSRTALEVYKHVGGKWLVVCPASVRGTWLAQCDRWLGSLYSYDVMWTYADMPHNVELSIVSYEWLGKNGAYGNFRNVFSGLIFDEIHYLKNSRSNRGESALTLSQMNPHAIKLGLTATLVANELQDLWHQLHVLSPGRFSSFMRFAKDYLDFTEGTYGGIEITGLKPEREEELKWRLSKIMIRKTKDEVRDLLPPLSVSINWHYEKKASKEEINAKDFTSSALNAHVEAIAPMKVKLTVDRILEYMEDKSEFKICVLTHLISTAESIGALLKSKLKEKDEDIVEVVHGEIVNRKRDMIISRAVNSPKSILIATMHSVGTGKDELKVYKDIIFAELYWSPQVLIQTLGRFVRMGSSGDPVNVEMLGLRGTTDEALALALERKVSDALKVGGLGSDGELMKNSFANEDGDEESFLEMLREQLSTQVEGDEYGI
jgi:superfamily II DNA or RNA helicase